MHDKRREANTSPPKCSTKCLSQTEKRGLGLRGRAYKDSVDIKHPPSFIVYCGQMLQRNNLKAALGLSKTDENY